jgi:hypothetical protein
MSGLLSASHCRQSMDVWKGEQCLAAEILGGLVRASK